MSNGVDKSAKVPVMEGITGRLHDRLVELTDAQNLVINRIICFKHFGQEESPKETEKKIEINFGDAKIVERFNFLEGQLGECIYRENEILDRLKELV